MSLGTEIQPRPSPVDDATLPSPVLMTPLRRCGSHALRLRLNQSDQLFSPYPVHIVDFVPQLPLYGDLSEDRNFLNLLTDVVGLHRNNLVTWPTAIPDPDGLFEALRDGPRTVHAIAWSILLSAGREKGARVVMDKSLDSVKYAAELIELLPTLRFLNVVRDPRAQVSSMNRAIIYDFDTLLNTERWVSAYQMGAVLEDKYPEQVLTIRYEDFVANEMDTLKKICDFLGINFSSDMVAIDRSTEARELARRSDLWSWNASEPIPGHITKYRELLSIEERLIIETATADLMTRYGYQREFKEVIEITPKMREEAAIRSEASRRTAWSALEKSNPSDFFARAARREYLERLKQLRGQ